MFSTTLLRVVVATCSIALGLPACSQPKSDEQTPELQVGTFCATAPLGLSIVAGHGHGPAFLINPEHDSFGSSKFDGSDDALARYGTSAADGSYFTTRFTHGSAHITMTWGKLNDSSVGVLLASNQAQDLSLTLPQLWSASRTIFWKKDDGLDGEGFDGDTGKAVWFHLRAQPPMTEVEAKRQRDARFKIHLDPARPAVLIATIGNDPAPSFDSVAATLDAAGKAYAARRIAAGGDWGDFLGPIADAMNGSQMYSSVDHRIAYSVGRGWWIFHQSPINNDPDQDPYFCWDSFFNANLGSLEDPARARETIRGALSYADPDGMIGNYSHWSAGYEFISSDRSQPPVATLNIWRLHQRWPDKAFLAEVYPKLVKWHDWWHAHRAKPGDFLLSWGSNNIGFMQGARWETGWDDTHSLDGGKFEGTCVNVYSVDLCSLWAMDAEYLAKIASEIGKSEDAARFKDEHDRMVKEMNDRLWNEQLGLYCNRFWEDEGGKPHWITRITPMNFYPMICGAPDAARAKRMLDVLHDPKKFWGDWIVPTLPYNDPDWHQQEYWHGHVWAPVNYLLWQGLQKYDDNAHLGEFAEKSVKIFMRNWNDDTRICSENYRSDNGTADDHPHYTWGALLPLIGLEALVDIGPDFKPVARQLGLKENLTLHHIPIGGKLYRVENKGGTVSVTAE